MSYEARITVEGIKLDVAYDYAPSECSTWDYPGNPEEIDINSVCLQGIDITALLSDEMIDGQITNAVSAVIAKENARAAEAQYDECEA